MNQSYSQSYVPAAAVIEVRLAAPGQAHTAGPFLALIDTGADASLMPSSIGVNPMMTIVAMASRVARRLAERLL